MRQGIALPVAGLVTVALAFGVWLGVNARPPGETEIIEAAAEAYMAETGGARTDCFARPSAASGVRLVVTCERETGEPWQAAYDERGRPVAVEPETPDEEPTT